MDLDASPYKTIILNLFNELFDCIETKLQYDSKIKELNTMLLVDEEIVKKNLSVTTIPNNQKSINKYKNIRDYYIKIISTINSNLLLIEDDEERKTINNFLEEIQKYHKKYEVQVEIETINYNIKNSIKLAIKSFNTDVSKWRNDLESTKTRFENEDSVHIANVISELVALQKSIKSFSFPTESFKVNPEILPFGKYQFVKKFNGCKEINDKYLNSILKRILKKGFKLDTFQITESELKEMIVDKERGDKSSALTILKKKVNATIDEDLICIPAIIQNGNDVYDRLSNGMNSSIYFDILATDTTEGIYIVDQPEDDVSQTSIRKSVISNFKTMSNDRQIIMITHNPQFVVNLDADNVICITRNDEGISIKSGALEYENPNEKTDILKMVAANLDGGINSIRKRWKRYDKTIDFNEED